MISSEHHPLFDQLDAYLLGSATPKEHDLIEQHLNDCRPCQEHLLQILPAKEVLLSSVPTLSPNPALKVRIMEKVRADEALFSAATQLAPKKSQFRMRLNFRIGPSLLLPVGSLATLVIILLVVFSGSGPSKPGSKITFAAQIDQHLAPGAQGRFSLNHSSGELDISNLPAPAAGKIYEVWLHNPGQAPVATESLFDVNTAGDAEVSIPNVTAYQQILVTQEPSGGSPLPTEAPILTAQIKT